MSPAEQAQAAYDEADASFKAEIAISLRDGFAAAALTGLIATGYVAPETLGKRAYEIADAMMAARGDT